MSVFNPEQCDLSILLWWILILISSEMTPMEYLTKYCIIRLVAYSSQVKLVSSLSNFGIVPLPPNSQEVMKWMMFWPEVDFKGKNDPLSWIAFKEIAQKKKTKKKRPEKIWPSSGFWCFKVSKWANDNWDWHMTEPHQSLNLSEFSLETCLIPV